MVVMNVEEAADLAPITRGPGGGRRAALVVLAAGLMGLMGCEPSKYSAQRLKMREERLTDTAKLWARAEETRPARLERAGKFIQDDLALHDARLKRAAQWFVDWQKRDVQRFEERGPVYLDKTGKILWGKPERVEDNAITLFY
jgi:hypothetical protein